MNDLLSQDEIDALLHGVDSGAVETQPEAPSGEARSYDFASQDRIIRGRMPTLEMVHERFARLNGLRYVLELRIEGEHLGRQSSQLVEASIRRLPRPPCRHQARRE